MRQDILLLSRTPANNMTVIHKRLSSTHTYTIYILYIYIYSTLSCTKTINTNSVTRPVEYLERSYRCRERERERERDIES